MTTFSYVAAFPATESTTARTRTSRFGNAEERLAYGINVIADTWSVKFLARDDTDRDGILAFLETQAGLTPFTWTTPFADTAQFLCPSWDSSVDSCGLNSIGASFVLCPTADGPNIATPAAPSTAFSWAPDFGASRKFDTKAKGMAFGDGYTQTLTMGLHPQDVEWQLTFSQRTNIERDAIRAYLRGARGQTAFSWTPPHGAAGRFVCSEWKTDYAAFNGNTINATFRQVFEP